VAPKNGMMHDYVDRRIIVHSSIYGRYCATMLKLFSSGIFYASYEQHWNLSAQLKSRSTLAGNNDEMCAIKKQEASDLRQQPTARHMMPLQLSEHDHTKQPLNFLALA
jgi:hypothetical protein